MKLALVALACLGLGLGGCRRPAQDDEAMRQKIDEIVTTSQALGKALCACADVACAMQVQQRRDRWRAQTRREIDELEAQVHAELTATPQQVARMHGDWDTCAIKLGLAHTDDVELVTEH